MTIQIYSLADLTRLVSRVAIVAMIFWIPVLAIDGISASPDDIIVDTQRVSKGAGFVLMVSLQRAR